MGHLTLPGCTHGSGAALEFNAQARKLNRVMQKMKVALFKWLLLS
jgi:hypothetical protein